MIFLLTPSFTWAAEHSQGAGVANRMHVSRHRGCVIWETNCKAWLFLTQMTGEKAWMICQGGKEVLWLPHPMPSMITVTPSRIQQESYHKTNTWHSSPWILILHTFPYPAYILHSFTDILLYPAQLLTPLIRANNSVWMMKLYIHSIVLLPIYGIVITYLRFTVISHHHLSCSSAHSSSHPRLCSSVLQHLSHSAPFLSVSVFEFTLGISIFNDVFTRYSSYSVRQSES